VTTKGPKKPGWASRLGIELAWLTLWPIVWILMKCLYRICVVGAENVPPKGPTILVSNHLTWLDGFFIAMTMKRRVRFLVYAPYTQNRLLRWFFRLAEVIPIASEAGPRAIVSAMREVSEALERGEVIGIFPEGALTRTGGMLPFNRGVETILKRNPVPVVPMCLDRLWGSIFSHQGGKFFWKWPKAWRYPVTVMYGKPLPPDIKLWQLRQVIQQLQSQCFLLRREDHKPAHRQFVRMACRHPFRSCIIDGLTEGKELNFAQTLTAASLLAEVLRPKVADQPMVGILLPTTLGGALANVAVAFLGKPAVNLNYTASREAMQSALKQCQITKVVTARAFRERIRPDLGPQVEYIELEDLRQQIPRWRQIYRYLQVVCLPGWWLEYVTLRLGRHRGDQLATVIFSSGSTGDPKGIMLSHDNIVGNIESCLQALDPLPGDRMLAVLPFFHSFGYTVTLWLPLTIGASAVYYPDPRQAKEIGALCKKYRCTLFVTTPTFLRFMIRRCEPDDFQSLRLLITGAEKLPQSVAEEFRAKFGVTPLEGYGTTELSPVVATNVPDYRSPVLTQIGHKPGTVGHPLPGVSVKIVDPDDYSKTLPPGETGMLLVKGPNVMVGYLGRPEATAEAIRDGWYVTGDLASLDEDGFITIRDRLSRFSKVAGEMVPHQKVEDVIHGILKTSERVCVVTGVPDERKGERLVVLHVPLAEMDPKRLCELLASSDLPNLWLPSPNCFYQVPEIPILGSGKLDLQRVKQMAAHFAKTQP
jgi:acyl-[acyl-carrier-protein]-phospholipid O-acyltransferase/long-chain-fatty-acid--[acyl-carrier-protein] ligase